MFSASALSLHNRANTLAGCTFGLRVVTKTAIFSAYGAKLCLQSLDPGNPGEMWSLRLLRCAPTGARAGISLTNTTRHSRLQPLKRRLDSSTSHPSPASSHLPPPCCSDSPACVFLAGQAPSGFNELSLLSARLLLAFACKAPNHSRIYGALCSRTALFSVGMLSLRYTLRPLCFHECRERTRSGGAGPARLGAGLHGRQRVPPRA
jgi:hypothetical protein